LTQIKNIFETIFVSFFVRNSCHTTNNSFYSVILPNDFDFNHIQRIINLFIAVVVVGVVSVVVVVGVVSVVVVVVVVVESVVVVVVVCVIVVVVVVVGVIVVVNVVVVVIVVVVVVVCVVDETAGTTTRSFIIIPRTLNQPFD